MECRNPSFVLALGLLVVSTAACSSPGSPPKSAAHLPASSTSSTTVATTTVTTTLNTSDAVTTTTVSPRSSADLAAAKQEWIDGSTVDSAESSSYLRLAAIDLLSAMDAGAADADYRTAVQQLQQVAALPETGDTPAQMAEASTDLTDLNTFFGTDGLYQ